MPGSTPCLIPFKVRSKCGTFNFKLNAALVQRSHGKRVDWCKNGLACRQN